MSLEPKPEAKRRASAQLRFVLSPSSRDYLKRISRRTGLAERQVVDQLVSEARELERRVKRLGFRHAGEALAVLEQERG